MAPHDGNTSADEPLREASTIRSLKIVAAITHNDQGGAQEALTRLCHALVDRGHRVSLWYLYKEGSVVDPDLPYRFVLEKEAPTALDYGLIAAKLGMMLLRERPTALISFLPLANVMTQTLGWALQIPVRIASQRNPVQTYSRAMQLFDWYFGTCGSYTGIVVNSKDVQSSVARYPWPYRCRTQIIHNGVDPTKWDGGNRLEARSHFRMKGGEVALVSIGRLAKQKNQVLLIQILAALKNFRLFLAGSGPELPMLRTEAERMGVSERVAFLGTLDHSETRLLLDAADIFALPSLFEGQSNALLEAMSAGRPIVTSDIPSHRETLSSRDGDAGFLVPITDPDQWIETLRELGSSAARRTELGQRAKKRARDFSLSHMCTAFETAITTSLPLKR
ncbi:MAG: glycosyltransferase family 4 protein [Geminicoccaceae bacterium]